ncbi:hypothetical protein THAOC_15101 [Thalassiosira oceanica]|uniref:Uncharacterized protein n=1 Tax=Thalassiosira oceanica TaxID=159749 RepID=K0T1C3_THAOC|nr:hypothetical protein THAOC_15101 [Thalassiosira oceanica]|eukprot:EJK64197.1 hypothetical protein THAOC_15101 [Thalassiosira oceanica]
MKNVSIAIAVAALSSPLPSLAFSARSQHSVARTRLNAVAPAEGSRRNFVSSSIAGAGLAVWISSPSPSLADVSDGNSLPQGAAQFSRVIKVRSQLKSVAKRVAEQSSEMDNKEWDKIDEYLRTVYSAGNDMKEISKGMTDPSKKAKAEEDVKLLQGLVQAAQKPVSKKDAAGFGAIANKADSLFEDFFDQLRDVPDEL